MQTITEDLLKQLKNTANIAEFLDKHNDEFIKETPKSYLNFMLSKKNMSVARIAKESGVGEYTYKIFNDERKPSRNILIALAVGMSLTLQETQLLLRISKFAILDSRDKRDSIIIFGLMNHLSVFEIDDLLSENGVVTIN